MKTVAAKRKVPLSLLLLAAWSIVFVAIPLLYILYMSFLPRGESWGLGEGWTLGNYAKMLKPMYFKVFTDSFIVAILTTAITLLVGYPFAYIVAKMKPRNRSFVLLLITVPFWTNALVRIYGWITILSGQGLVNTILVSTGIVKEPMKLLYNNGAVLFGMVYSLLPFMILAIYNSVEKLDWSCIEASRNLGAGKIKAFLTVTVPLTMPGILAGCVLTFVPSVGLFFINETLGGSKSILLGSLIKNQISSARDWPFGAALSVIMMVMTVVILVLYKKAAGEKSLEGLL